MLPNPQETADLVTFIKEILNEKLHFLCSEIFEKELKNFEKFGSSYSDKAKKNTFSSGNASNEKNLHPGCRKFIFFNGFFADILFFLL